MEGLRVLGCAVEGSVETGIYPLICSESGGVIFQMSSNGSSVDAKRYDRHWFEDQVRSGKIAMFERAVARRTERVVLCVQPALLSIFDGVLFQSLKKRDARAVPLDKHSADHRLMRAVLIVRCSENREHLPVLWSLVIANYILGGGTDPQKLGKMAMKDLPAVDQMTQMQDSLKIQLARFGLTFTVRQATLPGA